MLKKVDKKTLIVIFAVICAFLIAVIVALSVLLAIKLSSKGHKNNEELVDSPAADYLANQLLARVNFSANPCENFYEYACGHWLIDHPLPADKSSWNAEQLISKEVGQDIVDAFKEVDLSNASNGLKFAKNFFDKCMDVDAIEKGRGLWLGQFLHTGQPEDSNFSGFENDSGKWPIIDSTYEEPSISLERQIGQLKSRFGIDTFIYTYVLENEQNSSLINLWLTGTFLPLGLGLSEFSVDYYLDDEYSFILDAYSQLQRTVAQLLAKDSGFGRVEVAQTELDEMLKVEKQLAQIINDTMNEDDSQLRTLSELETLVPNFKWQEFFSGLLSDDLLNFVKTHQSIWVSEPSFIMRLADFFKSTSRQSLQNFMIWRLIMYNLPYLSSDYKAAYTIFLETARGRNLTEQSQQSICVTFVRGNFELPNLGYGVAEALTYTKFNQTTRDQAKVLTTSIAKALSDIIQLKKWMDDKTKAKAKEKAAQLKKLVAYPDWVANVSAMNEYYNELKVSYKVSFGTLNLALRSWAVRKNFALIRSSSIDELSFRGSPVLTNAWYEVSENSIVIPIGELHSPAFGFDYPNNIVYGALGGLIGHEICHGFFDPEGAKYDGNGNKVNWWSNSSRTNFQTFQTCLARQFDQYCYPGKIGCVNGNQTLSENAADLAGLQIAYNAYQRLPKQRLAKASMFTSDQLFFLSFPIYFCGEQTDASLKSQLLQDSHTPNLYRVNGALRNMPEFSKAFDCARHTYMNPDLRCDL